MMQVSDSVCGMVWHGAKLHSDMVRCVSATRSDTTGIPHSFRYLAWYLPCHTISNALDVPRAMSDCRQTELPSSWKRCLLVILVKNLKIANLRNSTAARTPRAPERLIFFGLLNGTTVLYTVVPKTSFRIETSTNMPNIVLHFGAIRSFHVIVHVFLPSFLRSFRLLPGSNLLRSQTICCFSNSAPFSKQHSLNCIHWMVFTKQYPVESAFLWLWVSGFNELLMVTSGLCSREARLQMTPAEHPEASNGSFQRAVSVKEACWTAVCLGCFLMPQLELSNRESLLESLHCLSNELFCRAVPTFSKHNFGKFRDTTENRSVLLWSFECFKRRVSNWHRPGCADQHVASHYKLNVTLTIIIVSELS